jgi:hypothetical protein
MNSQNINNSNNSHDFLHYAESADKMEKISDFFNSFFWIHIAKAILYFLFMPEFISDYSSGAIDIIVAYIVSQIALTFTASYKEIYMNKTKLSNIAIAIMTLIDLISTIALKDYDYIVSIVPIIAIINEIVAQIKTLDLRKLKPLKGYPLFSELLDNPKYIPPTQLNQNINITSISLNTSPFVNANQHNTSHISIKIPHRHNKNSSHISVKIPPLNMPEPEKISVEDMSAEKSVKNNLFEIPPSADTPMEARLLGNATLDYSEFQMHNLKVEEINFNHTKTNVSENSMPLKSSYTEKYSLLNFSENKPPDKKHKTINLSKNKKEGNI